MARIRSVHPGMASDEAYMSMSFPAKAAWPLLWTHCDDHGVFPWKPIVLKALIFPGDSIDFVEILEELKRLGCVAMAELDGKQVGLVRNFCRYQRPKKPKFSYVITDEWRTFIALDDASSPPVPHQDGTGGENPPQRDREVGGKERKKESAGQEPASGSNGHDRKPDLSDPKTQFYHRAKELGISGARATQLLHAKGDSIAGARSALEQASERADMGEYLGAIIRGKPPSDRKPGTDPSGVYDRV